VRQDRAKAWKERDRRSGTQEGKNGERKGGKHRTTVREHKVNYLAQRVKGGSKG
jgi:hypothetical protein